MSKNVIELKPETFQDTIKEGVTLVDFFADWCMPCRMLAPTIVAVADEYEGKAKVAKINIDEAQELAAQFGVMSIPTVILFKDGEAVSQKVGVNDAATYGEMIDVAL